ncbi:MAG: GTP cyclohydrolase I [Phototrophicaceae bacterium]
MCAYKSNGNGSLGDNDRLGKSNGRSKLEKITTDLMPIPPMNGNTAKRIEVVNFDAIDEYGPSFVEAYESTEVVTGDEEQYNKIYNAVYDLLDAFNVNWDDPNYTDTPKRVAKAYLEHWANGYARKPEDEITVFPNSSGSGDLVLVKDMRYYSTCSHHLAPFHGYGAIAYLPGENLLGLSKLGRMLNIYSRRFQLQERIGAQTADKLMELLRPQGVMVMLYDTEHMCMSSRGVQLHEANTTTIAARGVFEQDRELRKEVLAMMNK